MKRLLLCIVLLCAIVYGLFDGPIPGIFGGLWQDLNWLGTSDPPAPLSISSMLRVLCANPVTGLFFVGLCALLFFVAGDLLNECEWFIKIANEVDKPRPPVPPYKWPKFISLPFKLSVTVIFGFIFLGVIAIPSYVGIALCPIPIWLGWVVWNWKPEWTE